MKYDYDLFTIGGGSGGVRASRFAAGFGARVAIAEERYLGGTCVNVGCIPKKLFSYAAHFHDDFEEAQSYGWQLNTPVFDWPGLIANKDREIARLNGVYKRLLEGSGVDILNARATVVDAHTVEVDSRRISAAHILVATGGWPVKPAIPGAELGFTSNEAFHLARLPQRIAVVGGGYIAVEFASIFNNFGVPTHLAFRADAPLRGFDEEVRSFATDAYKQRGVVLHPGASPAKVERAGDGSLTLTLSVPGKADVEIGGLSHVMAATGRAPNTAGLGLEGVGVAVDERSGAIKVDEFSRTTVPSIFAVGDVTNRINLTPVALMEGMAFARNVFGGDAGAKPDYSAVASAVFSTPTIASVGATEAAALAASSAGVDVYTSSFRPMKNTISGSEGKSMMKVIVDRATDAVVGMHMVGPDAAEIMQGFAVALKLGVTKKQLDSVVGIHPTAAEEFVTMRSVTRSVEKK